MWIVAHNRAEYLAFVDTSRVFFFGIEAVSRLFLSDVSSERTGNLKSHTNTCLQASAAV